MALHFLWLRTLLAAIGRTHTECMLKAVRALVTLHVGMAVLSEMLGRTANVESGRQPKGEKIPPFKRLVLDEL